MPATIEYPQRLEIDTDVGVNMATFTANGECLVGGTREDVRVWRVKDGKQVATLPVQGNVINIAASKDGRWIAAGSEKGGLHVWDAATYEQVRLAVQRRSDDTNDVNFSPGSTRLVSAHDNGTVTIWDVSTRRKARTLGHKVPVAAAKYSPQGDQIATATEESVYVWDSNDGHLLVDVKVPVRGWGSLLWCKNHVFVETRQRKVKQIDATTGSVVSEWSVPDSRRTYIGLPRHAKFVAHSADKTITFWDPATQTQLGFIPHSDNIFSFAFSPDDSLLAITPQGAKIVVKELFQPVSDPEPDIESNALEAWKLGQLTKAEGFLSAEITRSRNMVHHVLASRALVRARLGKCDMALADAKESIGIQRSLIGYIAKCVALISNREKDKALQVCDIAFRHFHSEHVTLLLLIKAVVLSISGEHVDAISRMGDLITDTTDAGVDPSLYTVQAYMHLLLGKKLMETNDYEGAVQSFEDAQIRLANYIRQPPLIVSLISGWCFEDLIITNQQHLCEALFIANRTLEASESLLRLVNQQVNMTEPVETWVSDFKRRCGRKLEDLGDIAVNACQYDKAISQYTAALSLGPARPQELLMKRSNTWMGKGARVDALNDAKEWARLMLTSGSWKNALTDSVGFVLERATIYQVLCEHLETTGRVTDAVACFHQISSELVQEKDGEKVNWTRDFTSRCCNRLEGLGGGAIDAKRYDEAISLYTAALSLNPVAPQILVKRSNAWVGKGSRVDALKDMKEWVKLMLTSGSWREVLAASVSFVLEKFSIYQVLCEHLETTSRITDAVACFHQMSSKLGQEKDRVKSDWIRDFKSRCCRKLEDLGDSTLEAKRYDDTISQYTAALSLDPTNSQDLLIKRSKACAAKGDWKGALSDANEAIKLSSSSPLAYERKYAALLGMGCYDDALAAFKTMLSEMSKSTDPVICEQSRHYIRPEQAKEAILSAINNIIRDSPEVLINASSGRLCDKAARVTAFESSPAFVSLLASMTTRIDHALIEQVVREFYRYVTLSHTWEGNEPLYEKTAKIVVYDLEASPTHNKLQMFCKIVQDEGFNWAWSDTCCINKGDHFVLQEALVSMFKWYEGSALTVIYLCDIDRLAELGALTRSRWNSRGWTFQEYHASKVVRIYTKDWTPYLGLAIRNHKESPQIILEMENATGISGQALMALRPGLSDIREKLRLASTRQTTRVEDAAYSLLGIFSMTLPVTYGEGDKALGRLLSQLLMSSGDASILAWSGKSGSFNSCLPTSIVVFSQPATSHIPPAISDVEIEAITAGLQALPLDLDLVTRLYERVGGLHTPTFAGQRMRLPCLVFKIRLISRRWDGSDFFFHVQAGVLGTMDIQTKQNFTPQDSLYLVHPWIDFLLGRRASGKRVENVPHANETSELVTFMSFDIPDHSSTSHTDTVDTGSFSSSSTLLPTDAQTRAYKFLARLRQPFGALLLASNPRNEAEYERVSTESLIMVQVEEITSATLNRLIQSVRLLDVL